jgi:SAM-dependent methyltransferase
MSADPLSPLASLPLDAGEALAPEEVKSCCAAIYEHPAVRWLLADELHPGGRETTRRALELIGLGPGDRLLDVASGAGASALLAARERGCRVVGVDYGERAVLGAAAAAEAEGLADRVSFVRGDAEALPVADDSFDAVLCECSLCTFPDKARAVAEMRHVLRPGGRVAVSDVVVDPERLPPELLGPLASIACVGSALTREGYEGLLGDAGFELLAFESRDEEAAGFARRIEDRLRGARLLGLEGLAGSPVGIAEAIELTGVARRAIADGALGYAILAARLPPQAAS